MIPGSNLLNQALRIIRPTTVDYYQFLGRTNNSVGLLVSNYAPAESVTASVQAVKRAQYQYMGLDYNKRYIMIWATTDLQDLFRDRSGDQIGYNGQRWELMNEEDWTDIDNWNGVLAVQVSTT